MCPAVAMQLQIYLKHGALLPKADTFFRHHQHPSKAQQALRKKS